MSATVPAPLVWQLVKGNNAFIRKNLNGTIMSAEKGNLYNKHSYKFSGLANNKSIDVSADGDVVKVTYGSNKNAQKPKKIQAQVVKTNARRSLKAIGKQVSSFRADLKKSAVARMAAVQKSLRVKKYTK